MSFNKRQETMLTIIFRLSISIIIAYGAFHIYQEPELVNHFYDHVVEVGYDVFGWGQDKLINYHVIN
jgi:hypothetical protein